MDKINILGSKLLTMIRPILIAETLRFDFRRFIGRIVFFCQLAILAGCISCNSDNLIGAYDYELQDGDDITYGTLKIESNNGDLQLSLISYKSRTIRLDNLQHEENKLSASNGNISFEGIVDGKDHITGTLRRNMTIYSLSATRQPEDKKIIDRTNTNYLLPESSLPLSEKNIDHAGIIREWDEQAFQRGARIYNSNCINCHGNPDIAGSIPMSLKFWAQPFKAGSDPYSMYQTISRGFGAMPPQLTLTPVEKYDVILYIQQNYIRSNDQQEYISVSPGYLAALPEGNQKGPTAKPYHPWSDMDYGNFFINTYELVDEETGPARFHSPGPVPYANEDYTKNNFAYKGIAVRLDKGPGGVSKGKAWMMFDHDLMRVAGAWTGEGFIDWDGILLNDKHETYPRTIGKLHFETPVAPGWANPSTGSFSDPRFQAEDGRRFGPLPKSWANYKGLYYHEGEVVIAYSVGKSDILEKPGMEYADGQPVFSRTLNISASNSTLKMRVAPDSTNRVAIKGHGADLIRENGFYLLNIPKNTTAIVSVFIADATMANLNDLLSNASEPEILEPYTKGGKPQYAKEIASPVNQGVEDGMFAIDWLNPPFDNPWLCRMKLSGIDFLADADKAVACATDGDVWLITGLTTNKDSLRWKRIASGLFQPLGIKVLKDKIYVICRDQIVCLQDLNGDDETDFYESFNHDHQVTDHFHEFAMGLQADNEGNLYYAKSGRHARKALIPQHGTLLKVSSDGSKTDIIATGFRAANGVCLNPDGTFIVTDQQGFWNPMNRVNWVEGKGNFYGNMWGYDPPEDTSRAAMEPPMVWIDMKFDRSPSEMLWVDSKSWGPLNGQLLSFSYGFGKIQLVLSEQVDGQMQGGVIDLPGVKFLTGVMRGRFNPLDGHLYACGMSAWGTTQMMKGGGLYRLRYTGATITVPVSLKTSQSGVELRFATKLDKAAAEEISNYKVMTWDILRSSAYGSKRYNTKDMIIRQVSMLDKENGVRLQIDNMQPVDIMTIQFDIQDRQGTSLRGTVQNTIHKLKK